MGTTHDNARVQKPRDALHSAQIWAPDTRRPDFTEECRRQCRLAAAADKTDASLQQFMEDALADVDGWTE